MVQTVSCFRQSVSSDGQLVQTVSRFRRAVGSDCQFIETASCVTLSVLLGG